MQNINSLENPIIFPANNKIILYIYRNYRQNEQENFGNLENRRIFAAIQNIVIFLKRV
jgi:hypothetical protein